MSWSRLRRYKSIDVAVEAFALIRRELPDARMAITGRGPDESRLRRLVKRRGLSDCVDFHGFLPREDLVQLLHRAHVFLNPSPKEGWGLTVVEANACGVPVVGSNRPGLKDSILKDKTGFLAEYGNVQEFAEKGLELLTNRDLWKQMSQRALEWSRSLTWERTADEMEKSFLREVS